MLTPVADGCPRRQLFYGWLIVAACFGILFVAYGVQFSYGVFLPAMAAETGWDRTSLSLAFSIYVFVYSILGAASGWCTDRFGPRLVIGAGALLLGGGLTLTSQASAPWQLYLSLGLVAADPGNRLERPRQIDRAIADPFAQHAVGLE